MVWEDLDAILQYSLTSWDMRFSQSIHVEERVDAVLPYVTNAQIGDSTKEEFLHSLGVGNFDVCIVAIGNNFQSSLETTSLLKGLGRKACRFQGGKRRAGKIPSAQRRR